MIRKRKEHDSRLVHEGGGKRRGWLSRGEEKDAEKGNTTKRRPPAQSRGPLGEATSRCDRPAAPELQPKPTKEERQNKKKGKKRSKKKEEKREGGYEVFQKNVRNKTFEET
jgi:hypothetical protein